MLHLIKGVRNTKKQAFRLHVVNNQKTYASTVSQNTLPQPQTSNETFSFTAEQLTKLVANVIIQIAQPQVCYPNPKQDTLDLKLSICRKILNAAKTILNVDITGKELLNQSILSAPLLPLNPSHSRAPKSTQTPKASTVLKSITPPSKTAKAVPKQPKTSK